MLSALLPEQLADNANNLKTMELKDHLVELAKAVYQLYCSKREGVGLVSVGMLLKYIRCNTSETMSNCTTRRLTGAKDLAEQCLKQFQSIDHSDHSSFLTSSL